MYLSKLPKTGIYYLYYRKADKKKTRISTHTKLKVEAMKFLLQFDANLKNAPQKKNPITLNEFKEQYLQSISMTHTSSSYRHSKQSFKELFDFLDNKSIYLNEISQKQLEKFLFTKYQTAKYSAQQKYSHLKSAFNRAVEWNLISSSPFNNIRMPKIPETQPAYIDKTQFELILEEEPNELLRDIYSIAFYTGLRRGEICNLTWECINFEHNFIKVTNTNLFTTKTKKERVVPMSGVVRTIFEKMKLKAGDNCSDYIFSFKGHTPIEGYQVCTCFRDAVRKAKLSDKLHFHSLRHSFASLLVSSKVSIYSVQKLLGHSNVTTTSKYSHLSNQNLVDAIKVLD
ncbi:MAG: hypothetical protein CVV24_08135 [Ignavibacteriae bacterium HGW-Ignavibacteriae-3]|nr:MAG: hypothetical protein CVV24_08135 [Ignavibacteriae bacterium HGW-Ignavibacteriae-3]